MLRNTLVALVIAAQIATLSWMVYGRENVIANGMRITLVTAPIDPRDPFRGDFVRLRYPMNLFASAPVRWSPDDPPGRGDIVYAVLETNDSVEHVLSHFTTQKPEYDAVFLRGRRESRIGYHNPQAVFRFRGIDVKFGIEQLFVEQGSGIAIEERQGVRGGMQNAMHMEVAVDNNGTAVITGYRFSDIAIQLEVLPRFSEPFDQQNQTRINQLTEANDQNGDAANSEESLAPPVDVQITIQNVSDAPVTLNNPGENCGFVLEAVRWLENDETEHKVNQDADANNNTDQDIGSSASERLLPANKGCEDKESIKLLTLAPEEIYTIDIDLTQPRWQLANGLSATATDSNTVDLRRDSDEQQFYRIVYRASHTPANSDKPRLWQGNIISQAFSNIGQID